MAATPAWTSDELSKIGAADELEIAPRRADCSLRKPVTIWVDRLGDDLYVRSVRGRTSAWFRGAQVRHEAHIQAGGVEKHVTLIETDDANDAIDAAYRSKYRRYAKGIVDSIVSEQARASRREPPHSSSCPAPERKHYADNTEFPRHRHWAERVVYRHGLTDTVAAPSVGSRLQASSVHFTKGARTAWHTHPHGQTIYVTEGVSRCRRRGGPIEVIRPGDRVFFEPGEEHIQQYLSANCFGDYLTRSGIDVSTRELLTFSMLVALGGCDAQVKGHVAANRHVGNDRDRLIDVVTQLLPFIGYPRTLNALRAIDEVTAS
ncbi:MAG: DUF2255 family protein [Ktedonobacterales bacterium]